MISRKLSDLFFLKTNNFEYFKKILRKSKPIFLFTIDAGKIRDNFNYIPVICTEGYKAGIYTTRPSVQIWPPNAFDLTKKPK